MILTTGILERTSRYTIEMDGREERKEVSSWRWKEGREDGGS